MSRHNKVLALCLLLLFVFSETIVAQDPIQDAARSLAAVRSLRAKCASYEHEVVDDTVREAVLNHLRQVGAKVPQQMPTKKQLQGNLVGDFDVQWNELVFGVTSSLDPEGKTELAKDLNDYVEENPNVKNATRQKYNAALTNGLPRALAKVERQLVKEQSEALNESLKEVLKAKKVLSQQLVCDAADGSTAEAEKALTAAVMQRLPKEDRQVLLEIAFSTVRSESQEIVKDGIAQLQKQREVFTDSQAVSKPGLRGEFKQKVEGESAEKQVSQRAANAMRPSYGVFSVVQIAIEGEVERWFDQRVADASNRVRRDVEEMKRVPGVEDEGELKKMILNDPQTHHTLDSSRSALELHIREMIADKQSWITDTLVNDLKRSKLAADETYDESEFRWDVERVLDVPSSDAHKVWVKVNGLLKRSYDKLLPKIRQEIALTQADQYAKELAAGDWWPEEDEAKDLATPLSIPKLRNLGVWTQRPTKDTDVLEETWKKWIANAEHGIGVFNKAQAGQVAIVNSLQVSIRSQIVEAVDRNRNVWIDNYVVQATTKWVDQRGEEVLHYPELLESTVEQIKGIVTPLMDAVAEEEADAAERMRQEKLLMQQIDNAVVDPKPEPDKPENTIEPADEPLKGGEAGPGGEGEGGSGQTGTGDGGGEAEGNGPAEGPGGDEPGQGELEVEEMPVEEDEPEEVPEEEPVPVEEVEPVEQLSLPPLELEEESFSDMFYRIGFWVLLALVAIITCCWYWNVRVLKRQIALLQQRRYY